MPTTTRISPENGWERIVSVLDKAQAGDTIVLEPGEYQGDKTLLINRPLTLQGSAGVKLNYTGTGAAVHVQKTRDVSLIGLNIRFQTQPAPAVDNNEITCCIWVSSAQEIAVRRCCCQGNGVAKVGIVYLSSTGLVEKSQTFDINGSGIILKRDPENPDQPSDAILTDNRCHDNIAGILFLSSNGQAENNECWGNYLGIALQSDPDSPDHPSDVILTGNRCHDNELNGILFFSSNGLAKSNECWGNKLSGIVLERNPKSPSQPSEATLTDNCCHDNEQDGILFLSSNGKAESNECWGNKHSGIVLQRGHNSPGQPSYA